MGLLCGYQSLSLFSLDCKSAIYGKLIIISMFLTMVACMLTFNDKLIQSIPSNSKLQF